MTTTVLDPQQVADFLQENTQFFVTHADVFVEMQIPHPHGSNAISLPERQILLLRKRIQELEWQLHELLNNAQANETIIHQLMQWGCQLLAQTEGHSIPDTITSGLTQIFDLNEASLKLWNLTKLSPELSAYDPPLSEHVRTFADKLTTPYCGANTEFEAVAWLNRKPKSLALIALRPTAEAATMGLLVLGSDDPTRFTPKKATTFLDTVGQLASAALQRLI